MLFIVDSMYLHYKLKVIIVDDGSTDDTANTAAIYGRRHEGLVHVLKLEENRGKGEIYASSFLSDSLL